MDWLFEADRDAERRFPWISIPGVASNIYGVKWEMQGIFSTTHVSNRLAFPLQKGSLRLIDLQ